MLASTFAITTLRPGRREEERRADRPVAKLARHRHQPDQRGEGRGEGAVADHLALILRPTRGPDSLPKLPPITPSSIERDESEQQAEVRPGRRSSCGARRGAGRSPLAPPRSARGTPSRARRTPRSARGARCPRRPRARRPGRATHRCTTSSSPSSSGRLEAGCREQRQQRVGAPPREAGLRRPCAPSARRARRSSPAAHCTMITTRSTVCSTSASTWLETRTVLPSAGEVAQERRAASGRLRDRARWRARRESGAPDRPAELPRARAAAACPSE